jgi:hypothetical protein
MSAKLDFWSYGTEEVFINTIMSVAMFIGCADGAWFLDHKHNNSNDRQFCRAS